MVFTTTEIFEIALQIERNGAAFYRRAAEVAPDEASRAMLASLAEMEDDHEATFTTLRDTADLADAPRDEELLATIRAMADNHVFDTGMDAEAILTGDESAEEILSTAIGLEKESVVYYAALKEVVVGAETRDKVQAILLEEMDHIAELSGRREALRNSRR